MEAESACGKQADEMVKAMKRMAPLHCDRRQIAQLIITVTRQSSKKTPVSTKVNCQSVFSMPRRVR